MFFSFIWIVSLIPFNNKPESSRDLTVSIRSFILSFYIISVVVFEAEEEEWRLPDPKISLYVPKTAADAAAVNPEGIKILLADCLITFFVKGNPVFSNGPRSLSRNPPDCIILDNWIFDSEFVSESLMKIFNLSIS